MTARVSPLRWLGLAALGGVNLWLVSVLVLGEPTDVTTAGIAERALDLGIPADGPVTRKPLASYKETGAHPIFSKTREPFVPPPPPPPKPPPPPVVAIPPPPVNPNFTAAGVMIDAKTRKVFLFSGTAGSGNWASEGEVFMGWKVRSVTEEGATLEQNGRSIGLPLYGRN